MSFFTRSVIHRASMGEIGLKVYRRTVSFYLPSAVVVRVTFFASRWTLVGEMLWCMQIEVTNPLREASCKWVSPHQYDTEGSRVGSVAQRVVV